MSNSVFLRDLDAILVNPASIQATALEHMRAVLNNDSLDSMTVSHPFPMLLESCSHIAAASVLRIDSMDPRHYAINAQTQEDLYRHMTDRDYDGRFGLPANTTVSMMFRVNELTARMVQDPVNGYKKIVLPRNSLLTVSNISFLLAYPVEIRQVLSDSIQVVYDTEKLSPVQSLTTNIVNHEIGTALVTTEGAEDYIRIDLEVVQTNIISRMDKISASSSLQIRMDYEDEFYMARIFRETSTGVWQEMRVTHAAHVYDPMVPTAVLRVIGKSLYVTIPEIYTVTLGVSSNIRCDLYQTKGSLFLDLGAYSSTSWEATFKSHDSNDMSVFTAPITNLQTLDVFSNQIVNGGRMSLSVDELRKRVVMNSTGPQSLPITDPQIETALIDRGYDIVTNVDLATNRIFQASRALPLPTYKELLSPASLSMQTLIVNAVEAIETSSVIDNHTSITFTPDTIFQNLDNKVRIVPRIEVDTILALDPDRRAMSITSGNYFYSPFHYVLDMQEDRFDLRAYYLDEPSASSRFFLSANASTQLTCSLDSYEFIRTALGFKLRITTASDEKVKLTSDSEMFVQLSMRPTLETDRAYLLGTLVGRTPDNERIYDFDLSTNFNLVRHGLIEEDDSDSIELTQFKMYDNQARITKALLKQKFDVLFSTNRYVPTSWVPNQTDTLLGKFQLPLQVYAISASSITLEFGKAMKQLWARNRSVVGSERYAKRTSDVYKTYLDDVYEVFDNGSTVKVEDGQVIRNKLHSKGDFELDDVTGQNIIEFFAGSVVLDSDNRPTLLAPRSIAREFDLLLVEAAYWFSNDQVARDYKKELANIIVDWITNDLSDLQTRVLEQSSIYLYPKTTVGMIDVMFGAGLNTSIEAGQSLVVTLSVDDTVASDEKLITSLKKATISVITKHFKQDVVSNSAIIDDLVAIFRNDVIDVRLEGLGGRNNFPLITVLSETDRCSIRKRLTARPDAVLVVEEDITFNIVRHRKDKLDRL